MKKYLLLSFLLISFCKIFCQDKKLLDEYKFRIDNYKELDASFSASGGQNKSENFNLNTSGDISGNASSSFVTIKSTNRFYQISRTFLNTSFSYNKSTSNNSEEKYSQFSLYPNIDITNRWYKKDNYFELGGNINTDLTYLKRTDIGINMSNNTNHKKSIDATLNIGIGNGRLENIIDMQNALWLNKILTEDGNLARSLTEGEMVELAKTLTQANNFRILDGRKRIKFILKRVDEYLQSKSLIKKTNIEYFNNLNDIIFFANNFSRKVGSIKFIKIISSVNLNDENSNNTTSTITKNTIDNNTALKLRIGTENFNTLGLKHQIDYGAAVNFLLSNFKRIDRNYSNNSLVNENILNGSPKGISLDYFVGYNFYPNTRTNVGASLTGNFGFTNGNEGTSLTNQIALRTSANYFISYNTKLIFNVNTEYNQYTYLKSGTRNVSTSLLSFNFNTGLNISL